MEIIKTDDFNCAFKKLPKEIQHLHNIQEERFKRDSRDTRLHIKKVSKEK